MDSPFGGPPNHVSHKKSVHPRYIGVQESKGIIACAINGAQGFDVLASAPHPALESYHSDPTHMEHPMVAESGGCEGLDIGGCDRDVPLLKSNLSRFTRERRDRARSSTQRH